MCVTGEGEGVRGAMLHSFLTVAGEEEADTSSPGNERKKRVFQRRYEHVWLQRRSSSVCARVCVCLTGYLQVLVWLQHVSHLYRSQGLKDG